MALEGWSSMSTEPIPLSELIAEMSEEDQAWVERQSAQLIAEERAWRAARGESPYPDRPDGPGALEQTQGANDADV